MRVNIDPISWHKIESLETANKGKTMNGEAGALAQQVVRSFRETLDASVQESIAEHQFEALSQMVREALAERSDAILDRLDDDLKRIRAEMVERRPLEI